MGRPRKFEEEAVLGAAMALFREKGFGGTSVRDLEAATELKAASLYNAFGNKNALFAAAMDHYRTTVVRDRIDRHLRPELGLAGLRAFFASTYAPDPTAEHGCLLTNTAVEYHGVDDVARSHLRSGLLEIRSAIRNLLEHVERTSGLRATLDIDAATQTLLALYQGLLVLLRMKDPIIDFDTIVDSAIDCIASRSNPKEKGETL